MRSSMLVGLTLALVACAGQSSEDTAAATNDSAFAALQERGATAEGMGIDQYASQHRFDETEDGGRIELQYSADSAANVQQIRSHLQHVAAAFSHGDFRIPGFVHDVEEVPGTRVMAEKRARIQYEFGELPRGGEIRIRSQDAAAVSAIHAFLAFQRRDHRAAGHSGH